MPLYIDKRELVNATQWTGQNINELKQITGAKNCTIEEDDAIILDFGDYTVKLLWEDFLCKKGKGNFYRESLREFKKYKMNLNPNQDQGAPAPPIPKPEKPTPERPAVKK